MSMIVSPLVLKSGDRGRLEKALRASTAPVSLVTRARIVMLALQGLANAEIARRVGVSGPTVLMWRHRCGRERQERPGRARRAPGGRQLRHAQKAPEIQAWLARHPRFLMRFTPTGSSWINQVVRRFGLLTDKLIRRGAHTSVQALEKDIRD